MKKNKKEFIKSQDSDNRVKDTLSVLLVPMSIILVGVLVSVSVLYSANVILQRDQLVTKSNLQSVVETALKKANLTAGDGTVNPTPTQVAVSEDFVNDVVKNQPIVMGDRNSKLRFIEFSDPSCPFCSLASGNPKYTASYPRYVPAIPEIKKLVKEGKASYSWVYLPTHGNGEVASHVFYCANEKGKFWEVHDKLMVGEGYEKVDNEVRNDFSKVNILADYLKNDVEPSFLTSCVTSKKYSSQLQNDISVASKWGAGSTPTFFVGTNQTQDSDFNNFTSLISQVQ